LLALLDEPLEDLLLHVAVNDMRAGMSSQTVWVNVFPLPRLGHLPFPDHAVANAVRPGSFGLENEKKTALTTVAVTNFVHRAKTSRIYLFHFAIPYLLANNALLIESVFDFLLMVWMNFFDNILRKDCLSDLFRACVWRSLSCTEQV
jgi:hypothetical protein